MTTPTPEQLKQWRIKFLSEEGYTQEVPMPDAHNYKRVLQDARFDGYLRAKTEMLQSLLDQPEGEPVGVVDESDDGLFVDLETPSGVMVKRGDKLYTHPAPRKQITAEDVTDEMVNMYHKEIAFSHYSKYAISSAVNAYLGANL